MIPIAHIAEWSRVAPWLQNFQIEQDLLISRLLITIFSDDFLSSHLAFRGGTALHKLFFHPAPRYSEDIDLVALSKEPIGPVLKRLDQVIDFFELPRSTAIKGRGAKIYYKFISEESALPLKLKIEINCQETNHLFGLEDTPYSLQSQWFSGRATLTTFRLNELLGTKLRALYQRKKGRDIFDLYHARTHDDFNPEQIVEAFVFYLRSSNTTVPTTKQFSLNLKDKISDVSFTNDMQSLLRRGINYDQNAAYEWIQESLVPLIDVYKM